MSRSFADDLALAAQCAAGDERAWERFVREYRPVLYRAADALDPGGGARELADSLYAELFGTIDAAGERRSLFRYFEGRSSLATWLRAVLAQRYVDHIRVQRRLEPLPASDEDTGAALLSSPPAPDPDRPQLVALVREAFSRAVAALPARDRLRLACYYVQELTLAETGRTLREHEATVSRQLARTRRAIRAVVERELGRRGLAPEAVAECFRAAAEDPGPLDLGALVGSGDERKNSAPDRSANEDSR